MHKLHNDTSRCFRIKNFRWKIRAALAVSSFFLIDDSTDRNSFLHHEILFITLCTLFLSLSDAHPLHLPLHCWYEHRNFLINVQIFLQQGGASRNLWQLTQARNWQIFLRRSLTFIASSYFTWTAWELKHFFKVYRTISKDLNNHV